MLAEPAAQLKLLNLADLDNELARVQHAARSLPEHQRIEQLMAARQQITDALVSITTEADDLGVAVRKAEADLLPVRARLEREEQRVSDGSVSDAKTLRSLTDEVAHLKRRISELEDAQLDLMGQLEESTTRRDQVAAQKIDIETELRDIVGARDEAVGRLRKEAQQLSETRTPLAANLPADLIKLYEKLRSATGIGAAPLRARRCGGCLLEVTIADLDDYRRAPANEVLRCVECDRILVRTPESGL